MSKLAHSHEPSMLRIEIQNAIEAGNTDFIAEHIEQLERRYLAAVHGRKEFRAAYKATRQALIACLAAINPPDRKGISMYNWNERLKAATKIGEETLNAAAKKEKAG